MKKSYYFSILSAPRFINPSQFELVTAPPLIFVEELEYKCLESGDEMLGMWDKKCSEFRRPNVRRKYPAAYPEAQIKNKFWPDILENQLKLQKFYFSNPGVSFKLIEKYPMKMWLVLVQDIFV